VATLFLEKKNQGLFKDRRDLFQNLLHLKHNVTVTLTTIYAA